jgi:Lon protease-like protein
MSSTANSKTTAYDADARAEDGGPAAAPARPPTDAEVRYLADLEADTGAAVKKIKAQLRGIERTLRDAEKAHADAKAAHRAAKGRAE